jgi:hypothetical protein
MSDSLHFARAAAPRGPDPISSTCLGRTCLKWSSDGELSALDLSLVLERLAQVDSEVTALWQDSVDGQPCPSIS